MTDLKFSVITPAYCVGDDIKRPAASLDAQTMPSDEFEWIIVDDGSPDDTRQRLADVARSRPNVRVDSIPNSGWPSRPRNRGLELATGKYVIFLDDDDSLYPDALRRCYEYAEATDADLVSPKESKSKDIWWAMDSSSEGNIPDVRTRGGLRRLLPMGPGKVYRRAMLQAGAVRFPDTGRVLWEDVYFNVAAYRQSARVATLADTPVYKYHTVGGGHISKSYGPLSSDYWDHLESLLAYVSEVLDGAEFHRDRDELVRHLFRGRALLRLVDRLPEGRTSDIRAAVQRSQAIQSAYVTEEMESKLAHRPRAHSLLLRAGRPDLMAQMAAVDRTWALTPRATRVEWAGQSLQMQFEITNATTTSGGGRQLVRVDDRVHRAMPQPVVASLPSGHFDVTDALGAFSVKVGVRDRREHVTWQVPHKNGERQYVGSGGSEVTLSVCGTVEIDMTSAGGGRPLSSPLWDLAILGQWQGLSRSRGPEFAGVARAALSSDASYIAYGNKAGTLSIDTAQQIRNLLVDSHPVLDTEVAIAPTGEVRLRLSDLHASPGEAHDVDFVLRRQTLWPGLGRLFPGSFPMARVSAKVEVSELGAEISFAAPQPGRYEILIPVEGKPQTSGLVLVVRQHSARLSHLRH